MHKKVQILIIETESKPAHVLILKTNPEFRNFWQNITGSVEPGEEFLDAANRELHEETGLKSKELIDIDLEFKFHDRFKRNVIEKCFLAKFNKKPEEIKLSHEHESYKWVKIDDINIDSYGYETSFTAFSKAITFL